MRTTGGGHHGTTAGVDGDVKAGLIELIDHAVAGGWTIRRTCAVGEVNADRVRRWRRRRDAGLASATFHAAVT